MKLHQFDMYSVTGFTGQRVVEEISERSPSECQRQFRFWHKLGGEYPD